MLNVEPVSLSCRSRARQEWAILSSVVKASMRARIATAPAFLIDSKLPKRAVFHLETAGKLLRLLEGILSLLSKGALKSLNNQTDFDSAIRRFDPSRPSQL